MPADCLAAVVAAQDGGAGVKRFTLTLLLLCGPAVAQNMPVESVTSYGSSLVGVWHGTLAQSSFRGLFGALTGVLEGKLGDDEATLADALAQLRLAFVQLKASFAEGDTATEAPEAPGAPAEG